MNYNVTIVETANQKLHTGNVTAEDENDAYAQVVRTYYGKRAVFLLNRQLTAGGSRLFGQIGHKVQNGFSTDTGTVYIDVAEAA